MGSTAGNGQSFSQWQYQPGQLGGSVPGVPIPGAVDPYFRNDMDGMRSMYRRTPEAQFPDGYLGTITSRRGDRMLDALKARQNQRSYQRGVHKGERIDMSDYSWPIEFHPLKGILRQAGLQ